MVDASFSRWQRWGYSMCNVGSGIAGVPINILLLYYLTQEIGLRANLAGLILALPKVWDALVDPLFGGWIDRISRRAGGRGPVTLVSGAVYLTTLVTLFSLHALHVPSLMILGVATILLIGASIAQTALGVTQFAVATEMTSNSVDLSKLLSMSAVAAQILVVTASILAPLLIVWTGGRGQGYFWMAAILASTAAAAVLLFFWATHRVPVLRYSADSDNTPLFLSIRLTWSNRAFYFLIAFVMCVNAGSNVLFGFMPFANHYVLSGAPADLSTLEGVLGVTVLIGMLAAPFVVRRIESLASMRICNLIIAVLLALMYAASFGPLWSTWLILACIGLASGVIGVVVQTATLNAARIVQPGSGTVALGFYLGIMLAGIKLGNSLGGIASGQLLDLVGFVPGGGVQTAATIEWLRIGFTLVPMLFTIAAGVCLYRVRIPHTA